MKAREVTRGHIGGVDVSQRNEHFVAAGAVAGHADTLAATVVARGPAHAAALAQLARDASACGGHLLSLLLLF